MTSQKQGSDAEWKKGDTQKMMSHPDRIYIVQEMILLAFDFAYIRDLKSTPARVRHHCAMHIPSPRPPPMRESQIGVYVPATNK